MIPETEAEIYAAIAAGDPQHDEDGNVIEDLCTCGTCGRTWNDARVTSFTPTPGGRCPFEYLHAEEAPTLDRIEKERNYYETRRERLAALVAAGRSEDIEGMEYADGVRWGLDLALLILRGEDLDSANVRHA